MCAVVKTQARPRRISNREVEGEMLAAEGEGEREREVQYGINRSSTCFLSSVYPHAKQHKEADSDTLPLTGV